VKDINFILNSANHIFADMVELKPGERIDKYGTEYFTINSDEELKQLLNNEYSTAYNKYLNGRGMFRGVHDRIKKQIGKYCILKPGIRTAFFTKNNLYNTQNYSLVFYHHGEAIHLETNVLSAHQVLVKPLA